MNWKACSLIVSIPVLIAVTTLVVNGLPRDEATLRNHYRRPAEIPYPDDDPYSATKAELGRKLFFDPILSNSRRISCFTCHNPGLGWADGRPLPQGEGPHPLLHRSPTLLNLAWLPQFSWNGKIARLEDMVFVPIAGKAIMNLSATEAVARLNAVPDYVRAFADAFDGAPISQQTIEAALATFVRTVVSADAPFDHWIMGEKNAISPAAQRGFVIFNGKAHCASCHSGWAFTDGSFHDIGVEKGDDIGRGQLFPTSVKLRYAFKTSSLRDVALRAPYMHNGSIAKLEDVIDLYNRGGIPRPSRSALIHPLGLTESEKADLLAFLETLSSPPSLRDLPASSR